MSTFSTPVGSVPATIHKRTSTWKKHSVLPGFGLTIGFTLSYLSLIVLLPLSSLFFTSASLTPREFWDAATDPRVVASYRLTLTTSFVAAMINAVIGFVIAWTLVRYRFPGRRIVDALIDLPFALPTAVSGIALTTLCDRNGWIGGIVQPLGIKIAYTPIGITIALIFIGLPFVVRTMQPAIEELDPESEEASASLGAGRGTTFRKVIFPSLIPSLLTGFAIAFARALGEYGSVIFIAGNLPMKTEITSLLITSKIEMGKTEGATAIAIVMLTASFIMLSAINGLQWWAGTGRKGAR
ncbi:MAG: sulfate ABC transporter permease subunit CysT [Pirellulales bacterium]